jgi:hypothetical protein
VPPAVLAMILRSCLSASSLCRLDQCYNGFWKNLAYRSQQSPIYIATRRVVLIVHPETVEKALCSLSLSLSRALSTREGGVASALSSSSSRDERSPISLEALSL